MKKNIKSSRLKTVIVKCANFWMDEFEIDSEIFDDIYVEAATRSIEKRKDTNGFKVTVILETWEKKDFKIPEKHYCYNTYRILINAGLYEKSEILRHNFIKMHGIDLKEESLKGENDNGESTDGNNTTKNGTTTIRNSSDGVTSYNTKSIKRRNRKSEIKSNVPTTRRRRNKNKNIISNENSEGEPDRFKKIE